MKRVLPWLICAALAVLLLSALWERSGAPPAAPAEGSGLVTRPGDRAAPGADLAGPVHTTDGAATREAEREALAESELIGLDEHAPAPKPPAVSGRVVGPSGEPVPGALVLFTSAERYYILPRGLPREGEDAADQSRTRGDGSFSFPASERVHAGAIVDVCVRASGLAPFYRRAARIARATHDLGTIEMARGVTLVGRVMDPGGKGVAGAEILLPVQRGVAGQDGTFLGRGVLVGATDTAGRFQVDGLAAGAWHLLFDSPGWAVAERSGRASEGSTVQLDPIVLYPGSAITGSVQNWPRAADPAWRIKASPREGGGHAGARPRFADVAADGSFLLRGLPPGAEADVAVVEPTALGGAPIPEVLPVRVSAPATGVELSFGDPLALKARVVDLRGAPVKEFEAFAFLGYFGGRRKIAEGVHEDGRFEASGLDIYTTEAPLAVRVQAAGFKDSLTQVGELVPGEVRDLGDLELEPVYEDDAPTGRSGLVGDCRLRVRVETLDGAPSFGQEVSVDRQHGGRTGTTDENGVVEWEGLGAGQWTVSRVPSQREWRLPGTRSGTMAPLKVDVSLSSEAAAEVTLLSPVECRLEGRIVDGDWPLAVATVRLRPLDDRRGALSDRDAYWTRFNVLSDSAGHFAFGGIPTGRYRIEIEHDSRAMSAYREVELHGGLQRLDVRLDGATVTARVLDAEGQPVVGASVEIADKGAGRGGWNDGRAAWQDERGELRTSWRQLCLHRRQTDVDGVVRFAGCVPGIALQLIVQREEGDGGEGPRGLLDVAPLSPGERVDAGTWVLLDSSSK